MSEILNKENPLSEVFDFSGQCHILAKGTGSISIERRLGDSFEVMTDEQGNELTFVGDGVIYNSSISSMKRIPHRLRGVTPTEITVSIVKDR